MPQYHWKGIDTRGTSHKGTITLESAGQLRPHLLEKNIALLSFREQTKKTIFLPPMQALVADFFYHLSVLLESGIPLIQALKLSATYTPSPTLRHHIDILVQKIECGGTLSDAMVHRKTPFSPLMIQLIRAGERANTLNNACKNLSVYLTKNRELIKKVKQAALLPTITLTFSLVIIISLFLLVVPQLKPLFMEKIDQLPPSTKLIFAVSNFLQSEQHRIVLIFVLVITLFFFRFARKRTKIILSPRLVLHMPVIGKFIILSNLTQWTQTLALLLKSGISLCESLELASRTCTNGCLQKTMLQIKPYIDRGQSLHQACRSIQSPYLPESLLAAVDVGEQTGKLELMLDKSATLLKMQLETYMHALVTIAQPVFLVLTGLIIAFLLLSIYLPLFNFS